MYRPLGIDFPGVPDHVTALRDSRKDIFVDGRGSGEVVVGGGAGAGALDMP
jgi:hypothetical protein